VLDWQPAQDGIEGTERAMTCKHLTGTTEVPQAQTPDGCAECLPTGGEWVHLRLCMSCGHVGCCDSSPGRHATAHFETTKDPVIRSFQPGETWRWCFLDQETG